MPLELPPTQTARPNARKPRPKGMPEDKKERVAVAHLRDQDRAITDRQKETVKLIAQGESVWSACKKMGYSSTTGIYANLREAWAIELYNNEKRLYEEAAQMTRKKVMDMLLEAYDAAKMISEPASMVSAAREVGKMCGYYEPVARRVEISVTGDITVKKLERMTDAELVKIIEQAKSEIIDVAFREIDAEEDEENNDSEN